jgi:hypothetical protein
MGGEVGGAAAGIGSVILDYKKKLLKMQVNTFLLLIRSP